MLKFAQLMHLEWEVPEAARTSLRQATFEFRDVVEGHVLAAEEFKDTISMASEIASTALLMELTGLKLEIRQAASSEWDNVLVLWTNHNAAQQLKWLKISGKMDELVALLDFSMNVCLPTGKVSCARWWWP